jgi:hypothetical protein
MIEEQCSRVNTSKLGYQFDPVPRGVVEQVRTKALKPADVVVLLAILKWRSVHSSTCWVPNRKLEQATEFSRATVHRSLARLAAARLVKRVQVSHPADPRNRTGYQFELLFIPESDRVSPERRGGSHQRDEGGLTAETEPVSPVSPNLRSARSEEQTKRRSNERQKSSACVDRDRPDRGQLGGSLRGRALDRVLAEEAKLQGIQCRPPFEHQTSEEPFG